MGQCHWSIVGAFILTSAAAANLAAQPADDLFGDDSSPSAPAAEAKRSQPATGRHSEMRSSPAAPTGPLQAKERIQKILAEPLREPLEFLAQPLRDVVTILSETYDIPIQFDTAALDAVAASPDVEVTIQINNVSLRSALDLMLKNAGAEELTYIVDTEVLLITTEEEAQSRLEVKVYRVDDLIAPHPTYTVWDYDADYDRLIDTIIAVIETESWMENGTGEGDIQPFPPGMIAVSQTQRVHEQLEAFLADLRRTKAPIDADHQQQRAAAATAAVTRGFPVKSPGFTDDANRRAVIAAIKNSVDWQQGEDQPAEKDAFLLIFPERVVVRHRAEVVRQVQLVVHEMTAARTTPKGVGSHGCSGGGGFEEASSSEQAEEGERSEDGNQRGGGMF